jgi:signal transduction histidine kinase
MGKGLRVLSTGVLQILSGGGLWLFVVLCFTILAFYGVPPALPLFRQVGEAFPRPLYRITCWTSSIMFFCVYLGWKSRTRFFKRLAALIAVYMALMGAISELFASVNVLHLLTMQIFISALVQTTSVILLLAEVRALRLAQKAG